MLWIEDSPGTGLLTLIMQSKSSFSYLPNNILLTNLQNLYLVVVCDNCSLLANIYHSTLFSPLFDTAVTMPRSLTLLSLFVPHEISLSKVNETAVIHNLSENALDLCKL